MKRLTKELRGKYVVEDDSKIHHDVDGYYGELVDKVARLENLIDDARNALHDITSKMETYRAQGRERSYQFRELMGQRAFYVQLLQHLDGKGLL